jgi:hypothetical protein
MNTPDNDHPMMKDAAEQAYIWLVRRGYSQHEAFAISNGPHSISDDIQNDREEVLSFLAELMCDYADDERLASAALVGSAINMLTAKHVSLSPPTGIPEGTVSVLKAKATEETGSDRPAVPISEIDPTKWDGPTHICIDNKIHIGAEERCSRCATPETVGAPVKQPSAIQEIYSHAKAITRLTEIWPVEAPKSDPL